MQKSIVTKYFCICSAVILACVVGIGSVLLLVSSQFYKTEKKEALLASVNEVITATKLCYLAKGTLDTTYLSAVYKNFAAYTGAEFSLVDADGTTLISSDVNSSATVVEQMDQAQLSHITSKGYFEVGDFNKSYTGNYFVLGMQVEIDESNYYIIAHLSAESLDDFLGKLINIFFITSIALLVFVLFVIYYMTKRLLEPINKMTAAAKRFGKGDFLEKLDIDEDNEIGILASTMNEMAYSLSTLENSRKSFIANVSHELKTPMTTIGGFVDGILDGTIPKDQHRHYLTIVSGEVSRLSRLVRSMLNIAKYETGEMELIMKPFDITDLTIKTVLLFEHRIEDKNLEIKGLDVKHHYVLADIDLTQQIIYNLVENAVKFVNEGGYISFNFATDGVYTTTSIRNSGEGLSQNELPKVFERFYKTDESHGKDKTGVGLGLSIVRSIINLHGGNILVRSAKGEYTEFSFSLSTGEIEQK